MNMDENKITVTTIVNAPMSKVWDSWTKPEHIMNWAFASDDWEAPEAENDLRVGGNFRTRMAARDKSAGFDFSGTYTAVTDHELIEYDMDDKRHARVEFRDLPEGVNVTVTFDPENENPIDMQRDGWQAISDNFKKYVEGT